MAEDPGIQAAIESLRAAHRALQEQKMRDWRRAVPFGDLVADRHERARFLGFGEGTSVYDSAVILGAVAVGRHCWIGPNTYLDGSGGLSIGDHVTIGFGSLIASHSSVLRDMSGGAAPLLFKPTRIGDRCFVGPMCMIEMGAEIGDGCYVHGHSVVRGRLPPGTVAYGNPARIIGSVAFDDDGCPRFQFNRAGVDLFAEAATRRPDGDA